jgi:hypothetical protein
MFVVLEVIELTRSYMSHGCGGLRDYLADLWNWMDWLNFGCFLLCYLQVREVERHSRGEHLDCSSYLCAVVGYFDDWKVMDDYRVAKAYLSFNTSVQLLKVPREAPLRPHLRPPLLTTPWSRGR